RVRYLKRIKLNIKLYINNIGIIIDINGLCYLQKWRNIKMNQKLMKKINVLENIKRIPAEELFRFISLNKDDKVLDLGAGVGYISLPISKYVDEVISLDFDEGILKYLETKVGEKGLTNIKTLVSDFKDIQLGNETVDKVVASISLHEVKPLSLALDEIYRVLKDKGKF